MALKVIAGFRPTFRVPGTEGLKSVLNPEWLSADYEGVRVLHPEVFRDLIIPPVLSSGGMTTRELANYLGVWQFVTGAYKFQSGGCVDPLEKYGRHFAGIPSRARTAPARRWAFDNCKTLHQHQRMRAMHARSNVQDRRLR